MSIRAQATPAVLSALVALSGCAGFGELEVDVYGEEFVEERIPADAVVDGWEISFDRFEVHIEDVEVHDADATIGAAAPRATLDLAAGSSGEGHDLTTLPVPRGEVPRLSYSITANDAGCAVRAVGVAQRGGDQLDFDWCFAVPTRYANCQTTAVVAARGRAELTIHADHLFYDDLVSSEPNVAFDIIAAADADSDGTITQAELEATDITGEERYQVGNRTDVTDLWGFIEAQSTTVGHIDGEGHCDAE